MYLREPTSDPWIQDFASIGPDVNSAYMIAHIATHVEVVPDCKKRLKFCVHALKIFFSFYSSFKSHM